jgi:hypothetical protein
MLIEVVKTIADLERELEEAREKGDNELVKQIEFALERLKKVRQFGEQQDKREIRHG